MLVLESEVVSLLHLPGVLTVEDQEVAGLVLRGSGLRWVVSLEPNVVLLVESPFSVLEFLGGEVLLVVVLFTGQELRWGLKGLPSGSRK